MVEQCTGKVIIIADSSKIGQTFSFTSAKIQDIDILITGSDADPQELKKIKEKGVAIYQVDAFLWTFVYSSFLLTYSYCSG